MGKKSTPPAPDYTKLAEMTAASQNAQIDKQTAANRVNQYTPWGSSTWAQGPGGTWTQTTSLSPDQKQQFEAQQRIASDKNALAETLIPRMQQEYGSAPDWSTLSPYSDVPLQMQRLQTTTQAGTGQGPQGGPLQNRYGFGGLQGVQGAGQSRQAAEDAIYRSATSRLDPQWRQQEADLTTKLANQGITQGSAAYQQAMDQFQRQKTDAYQQAQMQAVTGAGAEAQRNQAMDMALRQQQAQEAMSQGNLYNQMQAQAYQQALQSGQFGLNRQQQAFAQAGQAGQQNFAQQLQNAQFQNQQRAQQLSEMMQQRGFSLNEINAILSGTQVGMPTFAGYNTAQAGQGVDYSGAGKDQYSASMDAYNAAQAASPLNAAASLAGTAMKAYTGGVSDRRVKRDIQTIGRHPNGYRLVSFRFIGERGRRFGVIAQEVKRVAPELVRTFRGDVLMVDDAALPQGV